MFSHLTCTRSDRVLVYNPIMSDYYKGQRRFALGGIKGYAAAVQKHPQAGKVCCCTLFLLPEVRCLTLVHTGGAIDGLLIV